MDARTRKEATRRLVLARRSQIPPDERAARATVITESLLALPELETARAVLAYVSMRAEVPTGGLCRAVLASGRTLLLPSVADDGTLRASPVASLDDLEPGFRGIPEPRARFPVVLTMADVFVVPGVAFDPAGARLGYGGGFFDGFLRANPRAARIGVCFEVQVVEAIPMESHDEPVDVVVTEERVIRTGARPS